MTRPSLTTAAAAARPASPERGTHVRTAGASVPVLDPVLETVARALRGARARTGMSEQQVVAVLAGQGLTVTAARLRGWERTGVIRIDVASRLADVYGTTLDALAGRGAYRSRHHRSRELYAPPAGP